MPKKSNTPVHIHVGDDVRRLSRKIKTACSNMQETTSKTREVVSSARKIIAMADALLEKTKLPRRPG